MDLSFLLTLGIQVATLGFLGSLVLRIQKGNGPGTKPRTRLPRREEEPSPEIGTILARLDTLELRFTRVVEEVQDRAEHASKKYRAAAAARRRAEEPDDSEDIEDGEDGQFPLFDGEGSPGGRLSPLRSQLDDDEERMEKVRNLFALRRLG